MTHRAKQRSIVGLLAIAGVAAAVLLAVFGMPYGRTAPDAFAHVYTHPNGNTTHLHIDADMDGSPCTAPYDATVVVDPSGTHEVGVCIEGYDTACTPDDGAAGDCSVESFELHIRYSGDPTVGDNLNECNEKSTSPPYLDDNPDANDGSTASGDKLGGGWDCTGLGIQAPVCDDGATANTYDAVIICNASIVAPDKDLNADPGLLATVEFSAIAAGVDTIDFGVIDASNKNAVGKPRPGAGIARCGTAVPADTVGCFGAEINKVPDLGIVKSLDPSTDPAIAGSPVIFKLDISDNTGGPTPTIVGDTLPAALTYDDAATETANGTTDLCLDSGGGVIVCGTGADVVLAPGTVYIVADVPLDQAGKAQVNSASVLPGDPNSGNDQSILNFTVASANVDPNKTADKAVYSEGETIVWSITADSDGASPASNVVITDTGDLNQQTTSAALTGASAAAYDCVESGGDGFGIVAGPPDVATCTLDDGSGPANTAVAGTVTAEVQALVIGSAGNQCANTVDAGWADPTVTVVCLPPTVRMEKDTDTDGTTIEDEINLFIEKDGAGGFECLELYELVTNAGNDPDGVGAVEFQLKFDHKIFDIEIDPNEYWLSDEWTRNVDCSMTIITENYIMFACATWGTDVGQLEDGVAATIIVCPEPDMYLRLTPGQQNGVFRMLLDENCELADIFGDPLRISTGDLAPGVLPGGLIEVCSDVGITVRILEADLDLDCDVDLEDAAAIAFRYGAVFGNILYDPWYDLEPWNKDFDIDIKDLQKVFGRLGSDCDDPIPPQDPLPIPDP